MSKSAFDFKVSTAVCDAEVFRGVQRLFIIDYYTMDLRKCEKAYQWSCSSCSNLSSFPGSASIPALQCSTLKRQATVLGLKSAFGVCLLWDNPSVCPEYMLLSLFDKKMLFRPIARQSVSRQESQTEYSSLFLFSQVMAHIP